MSTSAGAWLSVASESDHNVTTVVRIDALYAADSPRLAGLDAEHTRLLAESAATFPPILVHRPTMRVIDGMHRLHAARLRGAAEIDVEFFDGTEHEAFILALRINVRHGLPLTLADRKAAAARVLTGHPQWSDRYVASISGLSHKTVGTVRRSRTGEIAQSDNRVGRDGHVRPMSTEEGRRIAGNVLASNPSASLREIARVASISVETARHVRALVEQGRDPVLPVRQVANPAVPPTSNDRRVAAQRQTAGFELLRNDPTLRFSESGRALLRLLAIHTMSLQAWDAMIESVPEHCRNSVVEAAGQCAMAWRRFATELQ